jgi:cellulose synthase/poly-beta-1,6-N-acetylglucosamine synthase-like glycosyltransferase
VPSVNKTILTRLAPDDLNAHFSKVANDDTYDNAAIKQLLQSVDVNIDLDDCEPYDANCFAILLSKLKATSAGPDGIPYWFYKTCSSQLSFLWPNLSIFRLLKVMFPLLGEYYSHSQNFRCQGTC